MRYKILEKEDLQVYNKLISLLGEYIKQYPAVLNVGTIYDKMIEIGLKIIPNDEKAIGILWNLINSNDRNDVIVNKFMTYTFKDVGEDSYWVKDEQILNRIKDLLLLNKEKDYKWKESL